ncbi:MAG: YigZ family protein [Clostridia bacterium]|nr:YigZ family protein [Clostridia bacterium]
MNTLKFNSNFEMVIRKSKFIGYAYRVDSEEQAKSIIKEIERKYFDARHIVYAYKIGDYLIKKENSSEPAGTAGTPILCAIENNNLTNTLVIVIRYFGGVLLGASNLYRAYSDTALGVINANEKIVLNKYLKYNLVVNYIEYAKLTSLANKSDDLKIICSNYTDAVEVVIAVKENANNQFLNSLIENKECLEEVWL